MADRPERVLAIDIDNDVVRGIVLATGDTAVAGGYAQLGYNADRDPAAVAARIAAALDVKAVLPVVVTAVDSLGEAGTAQVVEAIAAGGFSAVSSTPRSEAERRANPAGGMPESLVDCEIASGLLTSHAGLTLGDLAPVVGAGLGELGLGYGSAVASVDEDPVAVWQADDSDHATGEPQSVTPESPSEAPAGDPLADPAAVVTGAVAAVAGAEVVDRRSEIDDETVLRTAIASELEVARKAADDEATEQASAGSESVHEDVDELDDLTEAGSPAFANPTAPLASLPDVVDETVPPSGEDGPPAAAPVAAASTTASSQVPPRPSSQKTTDDDEGGNKRGLLVLALIVAAVIIGLLVWLLSGGDDDSESANPVAAEPTEAAVEPTPAPDPTAGPEPTAEPVATEEPAPDPTAAPAPTAAPEPTPEPEAAADPLAGLPPLSSLPERGAVFRPPILYLEGPVQTQEQADELYQRAIEVIGPDNVVNEYVVRPDAPPATDGNVRVEQAVLFQSGSAVISEEFIPTLELGVAVMALNPQVQMVVEGHTDSVGGEAANQQLSELRAQAVVEYLISRGVDAERLTPVGLGESVPVASNDDAEGRQINRRIEVNLLDLLAPE